MNIMRTFVISAAALMGISAGASLAEAALMVPFWIEMSPDAFYDWYAANRARLTGFYSPLQILSAVGAGLAWVWLLLKKAPGHRAMLLSLLLALTVLALFFVYFKGANGALADRAIPAEQLTAALEEWGRWQWARVACATLSFFAALFAIPNQRD